MCPDCSPPRAKPVGLSRAARTWRSPTGVSSHDDAPLRHGQAEPEVGHHGHHHGVAGQLAALGQVQGEQGEQLVPVDQGAGVLHGQQAVGVTVEGQAQVGPVLDHGGGQGPGARWTRNRR